jgi:hypothetical protein
VVLGVLLGIWGASAFAHPAPGLTRAQSAQVQTNPVVRTADRSDTSPPLRDIAPIPPAWDLSSRNPENPPLPRPAAPAGVDAALQKVFGPLVMPTPSANFEGIYNLWGGFPPDTNGEAGRDHYVQMVNRGFQVWTKTGTSLYGPVDINTLFRGFGGPCETRNDGDPIVVYDQMADRWLLTQFTSAAPYYQCIALSTSGDPTGSYYRYAFFESNTVLGDYPKFGVWPDAYYMSTNEFAPSFVGDGNYAFERDRMLQGDPAARMVYFHGVDGGKLPSDMDGFTLPPAGSPNYFMEWYNPNPGQLAEYKFHVDWTNTANSTYTGPIVIPVTAFIPGADAPQPGTSVLLDSLSDRLMFRAAYRNMGAYESIVLNHTVSVSGVDGIRWYEIRAPNATPTAFQQGTYSPDSTFRWMGSIAMDHAGNIAVGYSASSSTVFPSIRYAGRLVTDPPNQLAQGEATLIAGTGSQIDSGARWGDYSDMTVDPVDDCTFWYTTEYIRDTAQRAWRTRIGSFKFPNCTAQPPPSPPPATGTPPTATPTPQATATACAGSAVYTGSITNADPTQTSRINRVGGPSTCAVVRTCGGPADTAPRHYDSYTYVNTSGVSQCVSVTINSLGCANTGIESAAYLTSFDPSNICANWLADAGVFVGPVYSYSFTAPPGATIIVTVNENETNVGCANYTVLINNCAVGGTATPTPVGITPSPTPVITPSPTPTVVCVGTTYQTFTSANATMIPATEDIGNHCDDCNTVITLPFTVDVYGTPYTSVNVGSNGLLNFGSTQQNIYTDNCLPVRSNAPPFLATLFAYYDDLRTDVSPSTHGIYSATTGTAPNREFALRWHTTYFYSDTVETNFEVILHENSPMLSVIYGDNGPVDPNAAQPATGIQLNLGQYTSYSCHTEIPAGTRVDYVPIGCGVTPTVTPVVATETATVTPTATVCALTFNDVPANSTFYTWIRCLACRGIVGGYPCGGPGEPCPGNYYRPNNNVTRGQVSKIVSESAGLSDPVPSTQQTFEDVPPSGTFWLWVERLATRGIIVGYPCGGPFEPCIGPDNRPYFRPNNNVTRGQLSKITCGAAGWTETPTGQTFEDVPPGQTFYLYIERMAVRGIIQGYPCGSNAFEPCIGPANRPYFRPNNNATRGQMAKIAAEAFFPNCQTPQRK